MSKSNQIQPAFAYPGGKRRMLKVLLPKIPEHLTYVEPFAGGLAVLLNKPATRTEVVNDINDELITFYRYVRLHSGALFDELSKFNFSSRSEFEALKDMKPQTDLQKAVRWFLVKVNSFGGQDGHFQISRTRFSGFDPDRHIQLIEAISERLRNVTIECRDWQWVVNKWDSKDTFLFLDPPYVECSSTAYRPFSEAEMIKVRDTLESCKGKWLLTCDNSPTCQRIFEGHVYENFDINYTVGTARSAASEMIVMSPNLAQELGVKGA